jgi:hypothetical protein
MFYGDWLQRRELLSPSKIALVDAIPSTMLRTGNDNQPITYREWNSKPTSLPTFSGMG